jgi:hypothetical protein
MTNTNQNQGQRQQGQTGGTRTQDQNDMTNRSDKKQDRFSQDQTPSRRDEQRNEGAYSPESER